MRLLENQYYQEDLEYISSLSLPWKKLQNKSIMISGATGMIGSFLIDAIMHKNKSGLNCKIYALGRNHMKAENRFEEYLKNANFTFIEQDINRPITWQENESIEYLIHLASNTHPVAYASDPIGTITANVFGTYHLLTFAHERNVARSAIISSNEIYGENRGDTELFDEAYCGYIDCNTLRAGYPESKRCAEALCQAYIKQYDMDVVIPRLTRSYGPTLLSSDTKALSQFLNKSLAHEDIVLKSEGNQYYSYTYVADAVAGLLYVLLCGEKGQAYNVSDEKSDIRLKDLAGMIADLSGTSVIFEIPDAVEAAGFSKATKARLDNTNIKTLGYQAKYDIKSGIERTLKMMRTIRC